MATSWLKMIVPAMLVLCFASYTSSTNVLEIKCRDSSSGEKQCPSYCPKGSAPTKADPTEAWVIACACCGVGKVSARNAFGNLTHESKNKEFTLAIESKPVAPGDVPEVRRKELLQRLEDLKNSKKIPHQEFEWWRVKISHTNQVLLTKSEESLLTQLLMDCGTPWGTAYALVHPLAGDQGEPKIDTISRRINSLLGGNGKSDGKGRFSLDDLKKQLEVMPITVKKISSSSSSTSQ